MSVVTSVKPKNSNKTKTKLSTLQFKKKRPVKIKQTGMFEINIKIV